MLESLSVIPVSSNMQKNEKHLIHVSFAFRAGEFVYYADAFSQLPNGDIEMTDFCAMPTSGFGSAVHKKHRLVLHGTWQLIEDQSIITVVSDTYL